ncbi:hypothetical protein HMY34_18270 [Thiothrix subterranea]|uniref:N,N-dimethylformamidase beta subunit family domain-containing protein n=1 Tax=Thiothrix subterranea TaxID=2735563 RepID=UPI00192CC7E6|nr:N,N-dimethylformamidase beta subunit family domain-containing protein [Thiothrix subterranea]QQZ30543.1 hypothetical protein HMY34_18270 [Thiothrix subterranea]
MATILPNHLHTATGKLSTGLIGTVGLLGLTLFSPSAFAVSCDFRNGDVFTEICGYIEAGTVQTGGQMRVHVASTLPNFAIHMQRAGNKDPNAVTSASFSGAGNYTPSANSYNDLNWGSAYNVGIPSHLTSGIYELNFKNDLGNYSEFVAIKSAQPGSHSKVLVLDSLPTKIAYSPIGGKSMYGFNSINGASPEVSMERPTGRGQWTEHREFVKWLDQQGVSYEAASMMDLHRDPALLSHYNLVILVGHNEYWSKEMRDNWDNYLAAGGNAAIFSGNTMWWQVRFSADNKHMICYKNANNDPLKSDNSRVTTNWFTSPVNRPENLSTGVSFRHGGYANYTEGANRHYLNEGFTVTDASHWAFEGTGLSNQGVFGHKTVGYEVDGALFKMVNGKPVVTGEDGTPTNFQILATTPAYAINSPSLTPGIVPNNHNGQGWGTLGVFKPTATSGTVFVAPTISWGEGLNDPQVARITRNVIERLKHRTQQAPSTSGNTDTSTNTGSSNTDTTNNTSSEPQVAASTNAGGGGSLPLSALLLGLLAIFGLKARKP